MVAANAACSSTNFFVDIDLSPICSLFQTSFLCSSPSSVHRFIELPLFIKLKHRRNQVIDVHPGRANVSKAELKEKLARMHEVKDPNAIFVFKFRTHFGGGKSSRFGLIYVTVESAKKFEPKYRFIRNGVDTKIEKSKKQIKTKAGDAKKK